MKNNKIQPKAVQGTGVASEDQKQTVLTIIPKQEISAEELKRENERLKKLLDRGPKTLEEKIQFFKEKEEFIKHLNSLTVKRDHLLRIADDVSAEIEEDEFITDKFSIAVTQKKGYSQDEAVFKVNNPVLVAELLSYVLGKMGGKIEELQMSIEA